MSKKTAKPSTWKATLSERQTDLKNQHLWRQAKVIESAQQSVINIADKELVNFSSNDYLGLANRPELINAAQGSLQQWGVGSGASHLVCGHQTPHQQLEHALAAFVGAEQAVLFSTGYMANLAIPSVFLSKHDLVLQDKLNHASLIDGAQISQAALKRYPHADIARAEAILANSEYQKTIISTDGVFSMDGDVAPLLELKELADNYNGVLLVDDAHGLGVLGKLGKGSLEQAGLQAKGNVLLMGTLGKAFGSFGAFVAGDAIYIEQLIQSARSYIYTTALPPAIASASHAALNLIQTSGVEYRQHLDMLIKQFKQGVSELGLSLMPSHTPIQPLIVGSNENALALSESLYEQGFLVTAIRPPTVAVGSARLRFTFSASHSPEQIDAVLAALFKAKNLLQ